MRNPLLLLFLFCIVSPIKAQNEMGCEILSHSRYVTLEGNKLVQTDSISAEIFDQRGENLSRIQIHYSKGDKVTIHYAYIEDSNGVIIRRIKRSEITELSYVPNSSLYQDDFIKSFELKHNVYPYQVKYAYTIVKNRYLHIGSLPYFGKNSVKKGLFVIHTDAEQPIKYKQENIAEPQISMLSNQATYTWSYSYTYHKPDIYASEEALKRPQVIALPTFFSYGVKGSWESWESFGNYIYRLNLGLDRLPDSEKIKLDKLLQGVEEKTEKVRILYHYLQDYHRYVNVTLGIGGLKSYPAGYVCANRFGDCKALSNYMISILKYAGIEAYYTLVQLSDAVPAFDESFPAQVFNHVIVAVPAGADTLYLECTSSKGPFGYLGTSLQGRKALLVKENGSHLIDLPDLHEKQVLCKTAFNVDLLSGQDAKITMNALARGSDFEWYSYQSESSTRNNTDFFMRNTLFRGTFDLIAYEFQKSSRDSDSIGLAVRGELKNFYRRYENNMVLSTFTFYLPAFESPEARKAPVKIDYPLCKEYVIRYHLNEPTSIKIPQPVTIESPYGTYRSLWEWEDGVLNVCKVLTIYAGVVPVEDYATFFRFISEVQSYEKPNLNLEVK